MKKPSSHIEINTKNQLLTTQKRLKNILGHLDPLNPPDVCPIKDILANVTDKWSILIIIMLGESEKLRFNELKKRIKGISSKVLAERLKRMERDGYIQREMFSEVPIRVEYQLTAFGIKYLNQVLNLTQWINDEVPEILKRRIQFDKIKSITNRT
ncbi:winged helix-turn-helix transcriptional regulator [Aquimarina pacifica]|uniref:winged helix-turn-helix transcriptional regulator n=1 Tax=Aquimarina pacifica TaxID=1296415 RepID=UPI0004ADE10F|nr:helix-turn-helix domain-containing protein [Aquimarina pacifica]